MLKDSEKFVNLLMRQDYYVANLENSIKIVKFQVGVLNSVEMKRRLSRAETFD